MNRTFKLLMVLMAILLFSTISWAANTWTVDPDLTYDATDHESPTISQAITGAGANDIISVKPGTYKEDLLISKALTIKSATKGEAVIVTGENGDADTYIVSIAANNVTLIDIKLMESDSTVDDIDNLLIATDVTGIQLVRCIFDTTDNSGSADDKPNVAMSLKGKLTDWAIEYCSFTLEGNGDMGVYIGDSSGTTDVGNTGLDTYFNVIGNTFTGPTPDGETSVAFKINHHAKGGTVDNLQIAANIADKARFELVFTNGSIVQDISILSNTIKRSNALLIDAGGTEFGTSMLAGTTALNVQHNHFGSTTTNGNSKWAIRMDVDNKNIKQANVHINYNNFHYPMTTSTKPGTYDGHLNAATDLGTGTIDVLNNWWGSTAGPGQNPAVAFANGYPAVIMPAPYGTGGGAALSANTQWIKDYTKPVLYTLTLGGAKTVDWDGNGMIDRIEIYFEAGNESLDPSSLANTGFTVDGYTLNTAIKPKVNVDNTGTGVLSGEKALTIFLKESGSYDTGVTPDVGYSEGTLTGITGALAAKVATFTVEPTDRVVPLVTAIATYDDDNNGKLDKIIVTFSEAMYPYSSGEWQEVITFGDMAYPAVAEPYDASKASHSAGVVTFTLTEIDDDDTVEPTVYYYDTGVKPDVYISDDAASQVVKDASGNGIGTVEDTSDQITYTGTSTIYDDLAKPVAVKVGTRDATQIVASADGDGYLDGIEITFSEDVDVEDDDEDGDFDDFLGGLSIDMGTDENTIDLTVTATQLNNSDLDDPSGTDTIEIIGASGKERMYLDKSPWDTDATPSVSWDNNGFVTDAEGNEWVYFLDGETSLDAVDQAKPAIVEAFGEVGTKKLHVSFSEAVVKAGVAEDESTDLVITDFTYAGSTTGATTLASMSEGDASVVEAETEKFDVIILVNANFIDGTDVKVGGGKDKINAVAGAIEDVVVEDQVANTAEPLVVVGLLAWDVTAPTLGYTETMDADGDGWIDHIRLTFSEKINDASLYGYDGVGVNINSDIAQFFTVAGYTVVGLNMLDDNSSDANGSKEAAKAAAEANEAIKDIFAKDQDGNVINILDKPNDNLLYLMVQEKSADATGEPGEGDTAATPLLSIVSGEATGAKIRDRYTSYYAGETDIQTLDLAAPAIMGARMLSETEAELWFSEDVKKSQSTLIATGIDVKNSVENDNDIVWHVGSAHKLWNGNIEGIDVIAKNNWKITVTDDGNVPAGTTGRIAIGAAQLRDGLTRYLRDDDGELTSDEDLDSSLDSDDVDENVEGWKNYLGAAQYSSTTKYFYNVQGVAGGSTTSAKTSTIDWVAVEPYVAPAAPDPSVVGAPADLVLTDVPGDNGNWMYATFMVSADHLTSVKSYQFYREVALDEADANNLTWVYSAVVPATQAVDSKVTVLVPTILNGESRWAVVASTGEGLSDMVFAMKEAGIPVASLVSGAQKAASGMVLSAMSEPAVGGAIDNIAPAPLESVTSGATATKSGVLISWEVPTDVELKYQHGMVGMYTLMGKTVSIYGVDAYEIYRKTGTAEFAKIGTAGPGAESFVDNISNGATVYKYYVKVVDSNPEHLVVTRTISAIATTGLPGDNNGDGVVNASDFAIFAANYGKAMADDPEAWISAYDLNSDDVVNVSDFAIFAAGYGQTLAVAKAAVELPTSEIPFSISANVDESTSTYFVNVNIDNTENLKGFQFFMSYNTEALEFVENNVNGVVGLSITNEVEDGIIMVADWFVGEKFNGTVTLAFRANGLNKTMDFDILNAMVDDVDGLALATDVSGYTAKALPTVYSLSQNYPNPFNPTTTIDYSIPKSGHVELAIYNVAGQKVRTLVDTKQDASFFKIVWDGRNDYGESVASGLYFYRLVSGNFSKIEKMTLVK